MNKLTSSFIPLFAIFTPYLVSAQVNDNYSNCASGNCPYNNMMGNGRGEGYYNGAGGFMRNMMGNSVGPWGMHLFGIVWFVAVVVFWALIIAGIVYLVRYLMYGTGYHDHDHEKRMWMAEKMKTRAMKEENSAVTILKERYAKGEIDKKEYREKMEELHRS